MQSTTTLSTPETVAALCRSLAPSRQFSLLEFARFLKSQEAQGALDVVDEDDEAGWAADFNNPAKVENFARWADASHAAETPRPMDSAKL
jgi:hypothetical protein